MHFTARICSTVLDISFYKSCFPADINECQLQGVCPNGECLNTMGSYRCTCKVGFGPDPTFSSCVRK